MSECDEGSHLGHYLLVRVSDELAAKTIDENPKVCAIVLLKPAIIPGHVLLTERVEDVSFKHGR
jgi:hypothetical protein